MTNSNKKLIITPNKIAVEHWSERAKYRSQNRKWLGYSGKVALRMMSAMEDIPGMSQKELANRAEVSPQQISKIIKGQENLTLKTIAKFSEILGLELISFPMFKYNYFNMQVFANANSNGVVLIQLTPQDISFISFESSYLIDVTSRDSFENGGTRYCLSI